MVAESGDIDEARVTRFELAHDERLIGVRSMQHRTFKACHYDVQFIIKKII
jgi:hypothetical protein